MQKHCKQICYNQYMKTIHQVFTSLLINSEFSTLASRLRSRQNLETLKYILPADMQNGLLSISYRAPTLLFCFNHPSHAYNFNHYKKKDIMYCLKTYPKKFDAFLASIGAQSMQAFIQSVQISGYVPKHILQPPTLKKPTTIRFDEPASGTFINHATDPYLHKRFEAIRALIQKRNKKPTNNCQ